MTSETTLTGWLSGNSSSDPSVGNISFSQETSSRIGQKNKQATQRRITTTAKPALGEPNYERSNPAGTSGSFVA